MRRFKGVFLFIILIFSFNNVWTQTFGRLSTTPQQVSSQVEVQALESFEKEVILEKKIDPDKYIVGPGDEFNLNILQSESITYPLKVSPTGKVLIPGVGSITVADLLLSEATRKIEDSIQKQLLNAKITTDIVNIRRFRIQIVGLYPKPGFVNASPITRVSDIIQGQEEKHLEYIDYLGEVNIEKISTRNLILVRKDDTLRIDLGKFFRFGKNEFNPFLREGDKLIVGLRENVIRMNGGISIPGEYEFVKGETIGDIIQLAGGFTKDANSNRISLTRFVGNEKFTILNYQSWQEAKDQELKLDDVIRIPKYQDFHRSRDVYIYGEVKFPGVYTIPEGKELTLQEIIRQAGGFTDNADFINTTVKNEVYKNFKDRILEHIQTIPRGELYNEEEGYIKARTLTPAGLVSLNVESKSKDIRESFESYNVNDKDVIYIPPKRNGVEVIGSVLSPGIISYKPNKTVGDYIKKAGGEIWESSGKIFIIAEKTGQWIKVKENHVPNNMDKILVVPKKRIEKWNLFKDILMISGDIATVFLVFKSIGY